jgi:HD superfamily phosphohydrolase
MLNVVDDRLVVDHKGIYSIEKFLIARRLMYWQVYLHKTVLSSEILLLNTLRRAKQLALSGVQLFTTPAFGRFLYNPVTRKDHPLSREKLEDFAGLDDSDILASAKVWTDHEDTVLAILSRSIVNRSLYRIEIRNESFEPDYIRKISTAAGEKYGLGEDEIAYLVHEGSISNNAYNSEDEQIQILYHGGKLKDIAEASDMLDVTVLSKTIKKYFFCYPKDTLGSSP